MIAIRLRSVGMIAWGAFLLLGGSIAHAATAPLLVAPADSATNVITSPLMVWHPAPDAASYRIQVALSQDFTDLVADFAGLTDTTQTVGPLLTSTRHFWRVRVTDADTTTAWSLVRSFTTLSLTAPALIAPADGDTNASRMPALSWHRVPAARYYEVQVSANTGFSPLTADSIGVADTLKTTALLPQRALLYWRVRASDGQNSGDWSAVRGFTTGISLPPTLLSPPNNATNQPRSVVLAWHKAPYRLYYTLQMASDAGFANIELTASGLRDSSDEIIGPLALRSQHFWRVKYTEADSLTFVSQVFNFTVRSIAAPSLASPADGAQNVVVPTVLSWTVVPLAHSYQLEVALDSLFTSGVDSLTTQATADTSATMSALSYFTAYFWRVRSNDGTAYSLWSARRAFRTGAAGTVYPGDANNDGVVDARDILPLGVFYGLTGPARQDGSLTWGPQDLLAPWTHPNENAAYADCNGDGTVDADDIAGIVQNWHDRVGQPVLPQADPMEVCQEILQTIDQNPHAPGMEQMRVAVISYMHGTLAHPFFFHLEGNRPNPFRGSTSWVATVPGPTPAQLTVFDLSGKLVWSTVLPNLTTGTTAITWNGTNLQGNRVGTGVYYYKFTAGRYHAAGKTMLVR